jgi:hypothetical protein
MISKLIRALFRPQAAANTTSLPGQIANVPAGIVPDNVGMYGLMGLIANLDGLDPDLIAVAGGAATAVTLTGVQMINMVVDFSSTASSGITVTTPTAAQIIAALPPTIPGAGFNFLWVFMNDGTGQTVTLAGGSGVTVNAKTLTVLTDTARCFIVNTNVNAGTVTIVGIGGGLTL